jgi:tetratricopeptide (TPR) repeat protein
MGSFALNYYFSGENSFSLKVTNLGIHLVTGLLIFLFCRMLMELVGGRFSRRAGLIAVLVAALWLVHPINLTAVLYGVQRMASLSALFVLVSLILYLKGRLAWRKRQKGMSVLFFLLVLAAAVAGVLSKENALLLPVYFFLLEWLVLSRAGDSSAYGNSLSPLKVLLWIAVPAVVGVLGLWLFGVLNGYDARPFTLTERLLTETRVLFYYIGLILLPRPWEFSLFHDDIALSTGLFSPVTTILSILGLIVIIYLAVRMRKRHPLTSFGVLFFFAAHLMESTIIPLELVFEHRNYLASLGVFLAVVSLLVSLDKLSGFAKAATAVVVLIFFSSLTLGRSMSWQDVNRLSFTMVQNHPESSRANYQAARIYQALARSPFSARESRREFMQLAADHLLKAAELNPRDAGPLLAVMLLESLDRAAQKKNFVEGVLSGDSDDSLPLIVGPGVVEEARKRLAMEKPTELASINLLHISRCERAGNCVFDDGLLDGLFETYMNNPGIAPDSYRMAALLEEVALRAFESGDMKKAQELIIRAVEINPHMAMFKINGAVILASAGNYSLAMEYIDKVLSESLPEALRVEAEKVREGVRERREKTGSVN